VSCYFFAPCDKRKHTAHDHQQAASQARRIPLGDTLCGYRTVVSVSSALGRRSFHNTLPCAALLRLTPQSTIARIVLIFNLKWNHGFKRHTVKVAHIGEARRVVNVGIANLIDV